MMDLKSADTPLINHRAGREFFRTAIRGMTVTTCKPAETPTTGHCQRNPDDNRLDLHLGAAATILDAKLETAAWPFLISQAS